MTTNERITNTAYEFLRGHHTAPTKSGLCLQLVRLIIETALQLPSHTLYTNLERVERAPGDDTAPWARDLERTYRNRGWATAEPEPGRRYIPKNVILQNEPGSILHRWDAAKTPAGTFIGHIGILLHGGLVIENINPLYRKRSYHAGNNRTLTLTPIEDFAVTLVTNYRE